MKKIDYVDKIKLSKYHLQYSAVNSQLKNHQRAAESSKTAIKLIKDLFLSNKNSMKSVHSSTLNSKQY